MVAKISFLLLCAVAVTAGFSGSEDRLIKKYAMMKVYESCFGADVVDEVKREMKEACLKCSGGMETHGPPSPPPSQPPTTVQPAKNEEMAPVNPAPPRPVVAPASEEDAEHHQMAEDEHHHPPAASPPAPQIPIHSHRSPAQLLSADRLQAILSLRPLAATANRYPYSQQSSPQEQRPYVLSNLAQSLGNALYDFGNNGYAPAVNQPTSYWSRSPYYSGVSGNNGYYQSLGNLFSPASAPVYPPSGYYPAYFGNNMRNSRDLDMRKRMELMASRLDGGRKIRNITCVMQELGYLNEKLEPNYSAILERIARLPVPVELKNDMKEGVEFCRQFSMCLPETRKDRFQLTHEFTKPMSFFRCYKQKKLEACIMKDVRERYSLARGVDSDDEDDSSSSSEEEEEEVQPALRRSMSSKKRRAGARRGRDMNLEEPSPVEGAVFDFLYGPAEGEDLLSDLPF